jgi:hypothetical protein
MVRSGLAIGCGVRRKRTSVTLPPPAPDRTAWMPLSCGWDDMNAAFMSYEQLAGPVPAVTAVHERLCGTTGTTADDHARSRSK